ncbi:major facilitator superfamily domain-containing protein [Trichoderma velutinum]
MSGSTNTYQCKETMDLGIGEACEYEDAAHVEMAGSKLDGGRPSVFIDTEVEKRLVKKIDMRLLPILSLLYTMCLIDRTNIGAARISGINEQLDLNVGERASIALLVFYIGYVFVELPSNIIIKRVGPANWLAFLGLLWGIATLGIGFSHNWIVLTILRVILGIFEGGLFPGCIYLLSSWYKAGELQKKIASFFLTASFLSSFSNILAYGLVHISHDTFISGWRWIFIVEGAMTSALGLLAWFIVIDFPRSKRNKFLTPEETNMVEARLLLERGEDEGEQVNLKIILETVKDWKVWLLAFIYQTGSTGIYAFLFFLPIILQNSLGFSQSQSFLLSTPPAAFGVIVAFLASWAADKTRVRGPFAFGSAVMGLTGLCMIGFLHHPYPRYVGAFLGQAASNTLVVTGLAWGQNNVRGDAKRAVTTAIQVTLSAIGGIYSSTVFRQQDAPNYLPGIIAILILFALTAFLVPITSWILWRSNKKADAKLEMIEGVDWFRYTL